MQDQKSAQETKPRAIGEI